MSNLIHCAVENCDEPSAEPTVHEWPLMDSSVPMLCVIGVYLLFVLKIGPKMMENRPAYTLNNALILYNIFQIAFSVWLTSMGQYLDISALFASKGCAVGNRDGSDLSTQYVVSRAAWWYFIAKITELVDTVFFVLRKKQNQVTFLHVYHHTMMAISSWFYCKYLPGEQGTVIGLVNSFVHIIMYTYYLLAAFGPTFQKYLWWKKYITRLQLFQFGLILFYACSILAMDCPMPKPFTYFLITNAIIFTYLFGDFYRKSYRRKQV